MLGPLLASVIVVPSHGKPFIDLGPTVQTVALWACAVLMLGAGALSCFARSWANALYGTFCGLLFLWAAVESLH